MAFWNVMLPSETPEQKAIITSLEMQAAVWRFNLDLIHEKRSPIYLGVGCNTGEFAAGNIGSEERMEYTIIGDNVNLAQRIESMAGRWQVFVSESTFTPVQEKCVAIGLPPIIVKGKSVPVNIFSIRAIQHSDDEMVLLIPVHFLDEDDQACGSGILTSSSKGDAPLTITLSADWAPKQNDKVLMTFDLPELNHALQLNGRVKTMDWARHSGSAHFARISLDEISGSEQALAFFNPEHGFSQPLNGIS